VENKFQTQWKNLISNGQPPKYFNKVVEIPFYELKHNAMEQNTTFVKEFTESIWAGDCYIIKNAFSKDWIEEVKIKVFEQWEKEPSTFYKMLEGCPDFHRVIGPDIATKYSVDAIKHSFYYFPWNNDPLNILGEIYKRWEVIKIVEGLDHDAFTKNTPSDGPVDRIQFCLYPSGIGKLGIHTDPYHNQRFIISVYMSKRGIDYQKGGFYLLKSGNIKVDVEDEVEVGDMAIAYATIKHGVDLIDPGQEVDWNTRKGRWFLGLYTNDSDENQNRSTSTMYESISSIQ